MDFQFGLVKTTMFWPITPKHSTPFFTRCTFCCISYVDARGGGDVIIRQVHPWQLWGHGCQGTFYGYGIGNWWCGNAKTWWHLSTFCITITSHAPNLGCWKYIPSYEPKVQVIIETWDPKISLAVTRGEVHETQWIIWNFTRRFAFNLKELAQLRGQEVRIILKDDNPIFRQPYRFNEVERTLVQTWTSKLLDFA